MGKTLAEWKIEQERLKKIAGAKQITYVTNKEWNNHNQSCSDCQIKEKPYTFCQASLDLYARMAPTDWYKMPDAECINCKEEWYEEDYSEIRTGDELICRSCGMIHEVICVDWTIDVNVQATGRFDPSYIPEANNE